ncbi:MAG: hypothetical protein KH123_08935, partial [Azospirillum sp.]|nr:hypothetical protein [Azospirillum sp.]
AESNALRQSFAPQPMLRSSWLQLVIPVLLFFPVIPVFFSSPLSFPCSFLLLCLFRIFFFSSVIPVLGTGI